MSAFLNVVFSAPATPVLVDHELHRFVVERYAGRVLNNALQSFRFNVTTENLEVVVEPFLACASFRALLGNRRKQPVVSVFLEAMIAWANVRGLTAHLITITSRPRRPDKIARFSSLDELMQEYGGEGGC
jgi:hypothetical protein